MDWIEYNTSEIKRRYLFKFLSEDQLKRFLSSGNVWLSRADKFGDKMECVKFEDFQLEKPNVDQIEGRKRKHLISCWHEAFNETIAFWDTYSDKAENRRVVALRFEMSYLVDLMTSKSTDLPSDIEELIHGKVRYLNMASRNLTKLRENGIEFPSFRKEFSFSYEREYRFVCHLKNEFLKEGFGINIGEPLKLDFNILVNPVLKMDDYNCLKTKLNEGKFGNKLSDSELAKWLKPEFW